MAECTRIRINSTYGPARSRSVVELRVSAIGTSVMPAAIKYASVCAVAVGSPSQSGRSVAFRTVQFAGRPTSVPCIRSVTLTV
eukprot:4461615-Prymnesium_polylepis.1